MNLSQKLSIKSGNRQVTVHEAFYPVSKTTYYYVFIMPNNGEKMPIEFDSREALEKFIHEYKGEQ